MKKEFITRNGAKGMIVDCVSYEVEILKSNNHSPRNSIKFRDKKTGITKITPPKFQINWDEETDGGRLELKYCDRWGSEMNFIHYAPSDIKGMFDFIGKGYNIFNDWLLEVTSKYENGGDKEQNPFTPKKR